MSDSKKGSKTDLNESNLPLLEEEQKGGESAEKEQIELKEKDDSNESEKDKKGKKKKKEKKEKPKKEKGPNCIDKASEGLNLKERDDKAINTTIDLAFDDLLAEPKSAQSLDAIWKVSFVLFTAVKLWTYRILATVVAPVASIFWGSIFGLLTVFYVWVVSPGFRLMDFGFFLVKRVWSGLVDTAVQPVSVAIGAVFANVSVAHRRQLVQEV